MAKTETLHVRVDPITKQSADELLATLGMSTAEAIHIFLHQIVLRGGLPFSVTLPKPNAETHAAIEETEAIVAGKAVTRRYASAKALLDELDREMEQDDDAELIGTIHISDPRRP